MRLTGTGTPGGRRLRCETTQKKPPLEGVEPKPCQRPKPLPTGPADACYGRIRTIVAGGDPGRARYQCLKRAAGPKQKSMEQRTTDAQSPPRWLGPAGCGDAGCGEAGCGDAGCGDAGCGEAECQIGKIDNRYGQARIPDGIPGDRILSFRNPPRSSARSESNRSIGYCAYPHRPPPRRSG